MISKKQKIFDILSSSKCANFSLTIMSLFVSIASLMISVRQCSNNEKGMMPLIQIHHTQLKSASVYDGERVDIYNVGGVGTHYEIEKYIFLYCRYYDYKSPERELYLPISNLLNSSSSTGNYTGKIKSFYTYKNLAFYHDLYDKAMQVKGFLEVSLLYYYKIQYLDFKDDLHIDIFCSNSVTQGSKITMTPKIINLFENSMPSYRIEEVSIEMILNRLGIQDLDGVIKNN